MAHTGRDSGAAESAHWGGRVRDCQQCGELPKAVAPEAEGGPATHGHESGQLIRRAACRGDNQHFAVRRLRFDEGSGGGEAVRGGGRFEQTNARVQVAGPSLYRSDVCSTASSATHDLTARNALGNGAPLSQSSLDFDLLHSIHLTLHCKADLQIRLVYPC